METAKRYTAAADLRSSDGGDAVGSFCGAVDSLNESDAAAAFEAVAGGNAILLDGLQKIFKDGLVAAEVSDGCRRGALVFVEGSRFCGSASAEIGGDDAVMFEDDGAFGAGDFDAARIAGVGGRGGVENSERAAGKFEDSGGGIFGFDFVKQRAGASLHANNITEQPEEQVDGVDALIDQGAAAIQGKCAAPARIGVVLRRAVPLHAGIDDDGPAEEALIEPALELANVGLHTVLKNDAELDIGFFCGFDEQVGARSADFDGLFRENVEALTCGGDALRSVKSGGGTDDDEIHGTMP